MALSAAQLNASANVLGTFVYNPPAGTVLSAPQPSGASQTNLGSASFTIQVGSAQVGVPEPTSAALVAIGTAFLVARRHRQTRRLE